VITGLPPATPVTIPELEPTVASAVLLLVHVPPVVASLNVVVANGQRTIVPVIAAGSGLTVSVVVVKHPVGAVYVIITVVPPVTPVTIPDDEPTVALAVLLLVHVPPAGVDVSVILAPGQAIDGPAIGVGGAFSTSAVAIDTALEELAVHLTLSR